LLRYSTFFQDSLLSILLFVILILHGFGHRLPSEASLKLFPETPASKDDNEKLPFTSTQNQSSQEGNQSVTNFRNSSDFRMVKYGDTNIGEFYDKVAVLDPLVQSLEENPSNDDSSNSEQFYAKIASLDGDAKVQALAKNSSNDKNNGEFSDKITSLDALVQSLEKNSSSDDKTLQETSSLKESLVFNSILDSYMN
jgi:hypothetical protein